MSVEIVLDPQEAPAVVIDPPSAPSVTVATTGLVVDEAVIEQAVIDYLAANPPGIPDHNDTTNRDAADAHPMGAITGLVDALSDLGSAGGFKVYTSWAEVDAETESTIGVLTTDDWAPAGFTSDSVTRDGAFFITTEVQTVATGEPGAGVWRRQELRTWVGAYSMPIWRVRQTFSADDPLPEWWDVTYWDLPRALQTSLAKAEDAVVEIYETDFDNPMARYSVGNYIENWRTLTGFAVLPNDYVVAHVFRGGGDDWNPSSNWTQTVVVALGDGTSRTITRVSTNGTSYGAWTLQPTIPDNVTISDDYVLTIGA